MANPAAQITVIYPMIELRGDDLISPLRSWTQEQTLARDRYRVIAAYCESDRTTATAMQSLLGLNDELLAVPDRSFAALVNAAIAHAGTPWLVLTEGHCIAQPGCLDAVMRWIEANPDAEVGNFKLLHLKDNVVTRLVARWYDDMLALWTTPPNWPHAIAGGFAIRAHLFGNVGALDSAFSAFAPHLQSARLNARGTAVTSVPGAAVIHLDEESMAELRDSTSRYVRGELVARSQLDPVFMERYFGGSPPWSNQMRFRPGTALAMARAAISALPTNPSKAAALTGASLSLLGEAIAGLRVRIAANRLLLALDAILIEKLPIPDELRWRRFMSSHQRVVRLTQLEWLRSNPAPAAAGLSEGRWAIEQLGPNDLVGVHGLEEAGGRLFRWSEPVVMIRLAPRQTACELRIETGGLRGAPLTSLIAVAVAGRALPRKYCTSDGQGMLSIALPTDFARAAKDGVILICDPQSPPRDPRSLGLPIQSIAIVSSLDPGDAVGVA